MLSRHTPSMALTVIASLFLQTTMAEITHKHLHPQLHRRQMVVSAQGCFSSEGGMASQGSYTWQSSAHCAQICQGQQKPVMALYNGNECACGDLLPSTSSQVSDSECSSQCTGYTETCGGPNAYNVFLTGVDDSVGSVSGSSDDEPELPAYIAPTSFAPTSFAPTSVAVVTSQVEPTSIVIPVTKQQTSVVTRAQTKVATEEPTTIVQDQKTIVRTLAPAVQTVQVSAGTGANADAQSSPSPSPTPKPDDDGGSNTKLIGIAVGVVVGVVVLIGIIVASIFFARQRRRLKNAENGHARADSLNAFVAQGGTLPGMPPPAVTNDVRLDPRLMVERRRQSAGSVFADNEDYSRRILKVANPSDDGN